MSIYSNSLANRLESSPSPREKKIALYTTVRDMLVDQGPLLVPWVSNDLVDVAMLPILGYGNKKRELRTQALARRDAQDILGNLIGRGERLGEIDIGTKALEDFLVEIYAQTFHRNLLSWEGKEKVGARTPIIYLDENRGRTFVRVMSYQETLEPGDIEKKAKAVIAAKAVRDRDYWTPARRARAVRAKKREMQGSLRTIVKFSNPLIG